MAVVDNFYFSIFLRLMWEFLGLESERGGSICWPNNKIIDLLGHNNSLALLVKRTCDKFKTLINFYFENTLNYVLVQLILNYSFKTCAIIDVFSIL